MLTIRPETASDHDAVRGVTLDAFGQPLEANLVDALRRAEPRALSLVAEDETGIVGHILFTPVTIETGDRREEGMGLAPMAVASTRQRQGIGTTLVEHGRRAFEKRDGFVHRERAPRAIGVRGHGVTQRSAPGLPPRRGAGDRRAGARGG